MKKKKPIIGITSTNSSIVVPFSPHLQVVYVAKSYIDIITENGGIPVILTSAMSLDDLSEMTNTLDGILFIGGADIHPKYYGQELKVKYTDDIKGTGKRYLRPTMFAPDCQRDEFELALYKEAKKRQLPILGICRGMQLINIAEGGTLYQELSENLAVEHLLDSDGFIQYHNIALVKNSLVAKLIGKDEYVVSSLHHQSVDLIGAGLVATGTDENGVIEIIEGKDRSIFILGLQGHPERAKKNFARYKAIFSEFITRCSKSEVDL
jgi:putative glutamine amidotransferase